MVSFDSSSGTETSVSRSSSSRTILRPDSFHHFQAHSGTFTGFVNRAFALCSEAHLQEELDFLTTVFAENGYKKRDLEEIITEVKRRMGNNHPNANQLNAETQEGEEENKGIRH